MKTAELEKNTDYQFLEAYYDSNYGEVAIFGNVKGLSNLQDIIDGLIKNGFEGSHFHLDNNSGLDGNVNLIIGRSMESLAHPVPKSQSKPNWELPKDIPDKVISLVNEGKPQEAIKIFKKAKNVGLIEAKDVVSCLYRVRQAGIVLSRE